MKVNTVKGLDITVLSLGTVQLGMDYGIHNANGKPSLETSFRILDAAKASGINTLDTAAGYGNSEEVIGAWLKTIPEDQRPFIVTKAAKLDHSSLEALRADLKERVKTSRERLGLSQLPLLMLHNCEDYLCDKENVKLVFEELKASGDILYSGISAYSNHDYGELAASGFDAVQIPVNIFDWGQIENGGLQKLKDSGMMIFVRSVYLQGLVFQDPETLPAHMAFCKETLVKFRTLCDKYQLSPAVLALSYALTLPGVTSLVLGSETVEQVQQNAQLLNTTVTLSPAQMAEIRENFLNTDIKVLNPGLWPQV
jgi:aryl-alcohol dehydrogenase-like predicted oxidoreductase